MASRSWNKAELIGNLTRDPELRYTPSGSAVCTFSIATNRSYVTDGERKEEVDFHRIVAWTKLAELCGQLLKKGTRVFVSGRIQNRSWEGQDGQQRQTTEIVIDDMIILTAKGSSDIEAGEISEPATKQPEEKKEDAPAAEPKTEPKAEQEVVDESDLPF